MLTRMLQSFSPLGLLISGLAVGVAVSPVLRKGARGFLVQTTKMVLVASDQVKEIGNKIGEDVNGLMAEARAKAEEERNPRIAEKVHSATVAAVGTGLAAADRVRKMTDGVKERVTGLVEEARKQPAAEAGEMTAPVVNEG
jgi:uncharacterized membrane protein